MAQPKRLIIGLGSGRCGTVSLSVLLNQSPEANITHEARPLTPWNVDTGHITDKLGQMMTRSSAIVGDVAYSYLPYVDQLATRVPEALFVCLRRDRFEDVVESLLRKTERTNHWADHDGSVWETDQHWDPTMPSYPPMDKRLAVERYVTEYYQMAEELESRNPDRFRIFATSSLNSPLGVRAILAFCGLPESVGPVGIHENRLLS